MNPFQFSIKKTDVNIWDLRIKTGESDHTFRLYPGEISDLLAKLRGAKI